MNNNTGVLDITTTNRGNQGGHALFLLTEMITGKQPSDKFLERAQLVGMLIILGLFVLATYNDLMKFVF